MKLGLPLKEKIEGPTCMITFLGILLDSTKMEIRLPDEKVLELQSMLEQWSGHLA